jgi:arginyl-tRNA synthetase
MKQRVNRNNEIFSFNELSSILLLFLLLFLEKKVVDDIDHVSQKIGNSHLVISDFSKFRNKSFEFSWAGIVSKEDSGFMCHYGHARLNNLLNECKKRMSLEASCDNINFDLLNKQSELNLIQHLAKYSSFCCCY